MIYNEDEIRRIAKVAFEAAQKRNGKHCSVEKANVLQLSKFWREIVARSIFRGVLNLIYLLGEGTKKNLREG